MLFGATDTFAIEAVTEPSWCLPTAVWGQMRVWCQSAELGDFSERHCGLLGAYDGFTALARNLPALWLPEFDGMSDEQLYQHLDGLLHAPAAGADPAARQPYERFDFLTRWGEQFDNAGKPFIVCRPDGLVRVLYRPFTDAPVYAQEMQRHDVELTIADFIDWFEAARFDAGPA